MGDIPCFTRHWTSARWLPGFAPPYALSPKQAAAMTAAAVHWFCGT